VLKQVLRCHREGIISAATGWKRFAHVARLGVVYPFSRVLHPAATHHARRPNRLILGLMVALLFPSSVYSAGEEEENASVRAVQNPILRSYFRDQFLAVHAGEPLITRASHFSQTFVDRQIKILLDRLERKLTTLQKSLDDLAGLREQLVQGGEVDKRFQLRWKQSTRQISESSDSLHGILSPIFFQLPDHDDFRARIIQGPRNLFYRYEIRYLRRQGESAARIIRAYFFDHDSTVHLSDLRYTNMLIFLHHAHQMARVLHKELS